MAESIFGGMTDYNNQSFDDILKALDNKRKQTILFRDEIIKNKCILETNLYWNNNVPLNFRCQVAYAIDHFDNVISEIDDILKDIKYEVKKHHIKRLEKLSTIAQSINVDIGRIWNQEYDDQDYDNPDFKIVEQIYCDTRDMAVNLLDVSNISKRLNDYVGKSDVKIKTNSPWSTGKSYLLMAVIIIGIVAAVFYFFNLKLAVSILVFAVILIILVVLFQLKNDGKIGDKDFASIIKLVLNKIKLNL